jgi:predicted Zn-dependent protease
LSKESGFDPAGLKVFFKKLDEEFGDMEPPQWKSTHPSSAERVKAIDAYIDGL